jgi:hypothetical protein
VEIKKGQERVLEGRMPFMYGGRHCYGLHIITINIFGNEEMEGTVFEQ